MGRLVTLEELEAYRQEILHANREGRVPRYRDPREVFNDNPNKEDGFLVEFTEDELVALEEDRQRAYQDSEDVKEQVITEMMENGNVPAGDAILPVHQEQGEADTGEYLTREQAEALYDTNATHADIPDSHSVGALENPSQSPSVAPEESVVPVPGTIEGAPEPMQSIVEAAAIQGNDTGSVHQNLVSTPNPESPVNVDADESEPVNSATGGDNPTTVEGLDLPDLGEPTSISSPTAPENVASQTAEQQQDNNADKIIDPGTQQFQPETGSNAGPTVPGADTVQTPTLNDEAAVPSEPTNADAVNVVDNPAADSNNGNNEPPAAETNENSGQETPETPPTSE